MRFVKSLILSSTLISILSFTAQAEINVVASVSRCIPWFRVLWKVFKTRSDCQRGGISTYLLLETLSGKTTRGGGSGFLDGS